METDFQQFIDRAFSVWESGGLLMIPLFLLTLFIYYTAFDLLWWLKRHVLLSRKIQHMNDEEIDACLKDKDLKLNQVMLLDAQNSIEVKRHFKYVRYNYLPVIDRRIRFLSIIIAAGPLLGLLGTVMGMLSTFDGLATEAAGRLNSVMVGVSEALVTTQSGLIISIPAMVLLAVIIARRYMFAQVLSRLESYNIRLLLRCPPAAHI